MVVQRSKSRNLKEVLCYGLLVCVSNGLCRVQTSVVSKLFFSKCDAHGKNFLKEKQWPKLKERDPRYANQIPTCLSSKGCFSVPALCYRYVPEFRCLSLNYVMNLSAIYGNLCAGSHIYL